MSNEIYKYGSVYKIVCKDANITDCYVGSCCNFIRRKSQHKSDCNNQNGKAHRYKVYKFIRKNGGWENWDMIEIKSFPCETKRELGMEERKYIEELNATLNMVIPTRSRQESNQAYHKKNIEYIHKKQKEYREKNPEQFKKRNSEYHKKNRESIRKRHREYYEKNKERIKERKKEKRKENKDLPKS